MRENTLVMEILKEYAESLAKYYFWQLQANAEKEDLYQKVFANRKVKEIAIQGVLERLAIKAGVSTETLESLRVSSKQMAINEWEKEFAERGK